MDETQDDRRALSSMLWMAREHLEMWNDHVERVAGERDEQVEKLVEDIDAYRLRRGWSAHGFGGES